MQIFHQNHCFYDLNEEIIPSKDLGSSLNISLNHLLSRGRLLGILWEIHRDQPVIVIAALEQDVIGANLFLILIESIP